MPRLSPKIDAASLRDRLAAPDAPRLLDVRTPAEFAASHIPGSYNVPLDTLREHRAELRGSLDEVVLVCRSGARAAQAEEALGEAGMTNVHILDGGIVAWEAAGAPLNRNRSRWDLERQVRLVAGSLVVAGVVGGLVVPGLQWLAAGVGAGLTVAALTNTCTMGMLLSKLPFNRAPSCSVVTMAELLKERRP
ncbi:rhodanese-like domain-containing protein [Actinomadura sp. NPDC000600]|uniref:rhodanese-like domain-containing protein n=1 Tax=Actinomadura sp. NPDC000600 TaxID=3154262 RepID=UPI0033929F7B